MNQFTEEQAELFFNSSTAKQHNKNNSTKDIDVHYNMYRVYHCIYNPLKVFYPSLLITSGYRSKWLNSIVGGSKNSQHLIGQAVDLVSDPESMNKIIVHIIMYLPFDQLIIYIKESRVDFIHVSCSKRNRKQLLVKTK